MPKPKPKLQRKPKATAVKFPNAPADKALLQKMRSLKSFCTPRIVRIHRPHDVMEAARKVKRRYDLKYDTRIIKAVSEFMSMLPGDHALTFDREPYPWSNSDHLINRIAVVGPLSSQVLFEYAFIGMCACLDATPFAQLLNEFANDMPRLLLLCEFRIRCASLNLKDAHAFEKHFACDRARTAIHRRMKEHLTGGPWSALRRKCTQKLVDKVTAQIGKKFREGEAIPDFVGRLPNELKFHILKELVRSGPAMTSTILDMRLLNHAWKRETDRLLRMPQLGIAKRTMNVCDWLRGDEYWTPPDTECFKIFASRQTAGRMLPLLRGKLDRFAHVCIVFRPSCRRQLLLRTFLQRRQDIKFTVVIHLDEYDEINLHTVGWSDVQNVLNALDAQAPPQRAPPRVTPQLPAAAANAPAGEGGEGIAGALFAFLQGLGAANDPPAGAPAVEALAGAAGVGAAGAVEAAAPPQQPAADEEEDDDVIIIN
ncbi:hypothetical protein M3Y99_00422400 [Aphelenchoides fujianensis]|nr:hypothetical protein M3Y99_00422400 [Aphelenchoides fujianensis]